jgi:hypothetical protein
MRRSAFLVLLLSLRGLAQTPDDSLAKLAAGSLYIFLGTANGANVRVELIFRGAERIGDFTNQDIIVLRPSNADRKRAIFFVTPVNYGTLMTAREDGELPPPDDPKSFAAALARVDQAESDRKLRERLRSAEAIVIGRVESAVELKDERRASEHEPRWWLARVAVVRTLKGKARASTADVIFSNSDDIRWFTSPKLHPGDQGIFLLRHDSNRVRKGEEPHIEGYLLIDPEDFRPLTDETRVRALLRSQS